VRERKGELRVIIGAGGIEFPGWLSTEYPVTDFTDSGSLRRLFRPSSVAAFVAEHVWEHLTPEQAAAAARNCFEFLKPGGYLRIAVPDGLHPDASYIEYVRPGGTGLGSDDHKVLYNYRTLSATLEAAGLVVHLLEWFDEEGVFHFSDWDPEAGFVFRSARFDERNRDKPTTYTSIIVDAVKPARSQRVARQGRA
jgi:predicted SAM-dependent methyltransferase